MSARGGRGWIALAVGLLVLAGGALLLLWLARNMERRVVEVPMPPRGEAAYNPLYALKRALQIDGVPVHSSRRLSLKARPPAPGDTLVLLGDQRALPPGEATALLDWVERGGHLVVELPAAGATGREAASGPLLEALGVAIKPVAHACARYREGGGKASDELSLCGDARIQVQEDREVAAHWHDDDYDADYLLRLPQGKGSVDVLVDLGFLNNRRLDTPAAAALARQLLAPNYGKGTVHLVYEADVPPWWRMVLERGWMAWVPLLLALLGWLAWRRQRRGPLRPSPPAGRRSLVEHVRASGEHLHRYGRGHLLHGALRQLFEARLRRRDPLAAALEGDAQRRAIAVRTGVPEAEVEAALRAPVPFVAADLRLRISRLNRLRLRL